MFRRIVSIILVVSMMATSGPAYGYSGPTLFNHRSHAERNLVEQAEEDAGKNPLSISIPNNIGTVLEYYQGDKESMVIHIQDCHADPMAQFNIAKIIDEAVTKHGIHLMCLEGASKELDTSFYDRFVDGPLKNRVAQAFVKTALFTGAEFYQITNRSKYMRAVGAEERAAYLSHLACYRNSQPDKEKILAQIRALRNDISILKNRVYPQTLQALDNASEAYASKDIALAQYVDRLELYSKKQMVDMAGYKQLQAFIVLTAQEKKVDFKKAEEEREALIEDLTDILKEGELKELLAKSLEFRLNRIAIHSFYDYLLEVMAENKVQPGGYADLLSYIDYLKASKGIDYLKIFEEVEDFERELKLALCENKAQKQLVIYDNNLKCMQDLYSLKLTRRHLEYIDKNPEGFDLNKIGYALADIARDNSVKIGSEATAADFDNDATESSKEFYEWAIKRDIALVDNTLKNMKRYRKDKAILITGGFHTQGITEILKTKGVSYVVICPNMGRGENEALYEDRMSGNEIPYEELLAVARAMLVPALTTGDLQRSRAQNKSLFRRLFTSLRSLQTDENTEVKASSSGKLRTREGYGFVKGNFPKNGPEEAYVETLCQQLEAEKYGFKDDEVEALANALVRARRETLAIRRSTLLPGIDIEALLKYEPVDLDRFAHRIMQERAKYRNAKDASGNPLVNEKMIHQLLFSKLVPLEWITGLMQEGFTRTDAIHLVAWAHPAAKAMAVSHTVGRIIEITGWKDSSARGFLLRNSIKGIRQELRKRKYRLSDEYIETILEPLIVCEREYGQTTSIIPAEGSVRGPDTEKGKSSSSGVDWDDITDIEEVFDILRTHQTIQGSSRSYAATEVIQIIETIRKGLSESQQIPDRNSVKRLSATITNAVNTPLEGLRSKAVTLLWAEVLKDAQAQLQAVRDFEGLEEFLRRVGDITGSDGTIYKAGDIIDHVKSIRVFFRTGAPEAKLDRAVLQSVVQAITNGTGTPAQGLRAKASELLWQDIVAYGQNKLANIETVDELYTFLRLFDRFVDTNGWVQLPADMIEKIAQVRALIQGGARLDQDQLQLLMNTLTNAPRTPAQGVRDRAIELLLREQVKLAGVSEENIKTEDTPMDLVKSSSGGEDREPDSAPDAVPTQNLRLYREDHVPTVTRKVFEGDAWIQAGTYWYRISERAHEVLLRRYGMVNPEPIGEAYRARAGQWITVGRGPGLNRVSLPEDPRLSKVHFSFRVSIDVTSGARTIELIDCGSTNGTNLAWNAPAALSADANAQDRQILIEQDVTEAVKNGTQRLIFGDMIRNEGTGTERVIIGSDNDDIIFMRAKWLTVPADLQGMIIETMSMDDLRRGMQTVKVRISRIWPNDGIVQQNIKMFLSDELKLRIMDVSQRPDLGIQVYGIADKDGRILFWGRTQDLQKAIPNLEDQIDSGNMIGILIKVKQGEEKIEGFRMDYMWTGRHKLVPGVAAQRLLLALREADHRVKSSSAGGYTLEELKERIRQELPAGVTVEEKKWNPLSVYDSLLRTLYAAVRYRQLSYIFYISLYLSCSFITGAIVPKYNRQGSIQAMEKREGGWTALFPIPFITAASIVAGIYISPDFFLYGLYTFAIYIATNVWRLYKLLFKKSHVTATHEWLHIYQFALIEKAGREGRITDARSFIITHLDDLEYVSKYQDEQVTEEMLADLTAHIDSLIDGRRENWLQRLYTRIRNAFDIFVSTFKTRQEPIDELELQEYISRAIIMQDFDGYRAIGLSAELGEDPEGNRRLEPLRKQLRRLTGDGIIALRQRQGPADPIVYSPLGDDQLSVRFCEIIAGQMPAIARRIKEQGRDTIRILVLGSGCGIDASTALHQAHLHGLEVFLQTTDINLEAVTNTKYNLARHTEEEDSVEALFVTEQEPFRGVASEFDLIIFNAPVARMNPDGLRDDPSTHTTIQAYRRLVENIPDLLAADGRGLISSNKYNVDALMPDTLVALPLPEVNEYGVVINRRETHLFFELLRRDAAGQARPKSSSAGEGEQEEVMTEEEIIAANEAILVSGKDRYTPELKAALEEAMPDEFGMVTLTGVVDENGYIHTILTPEQVAAGEEGLPDDILSLFGETLFRFQIDFRPAEEQTPEQRELLILDGIVLLGVDTHSITQKDALHIARVLNASMRQAKELFLEEQEDIAGLLREDDLKLVPEKEPDKRKPYSREDETISKEQEFEVLKLEDSVAIEHNLRQLVPKGRLAPALQRLVDEFPGEDRYEVGIMIDNEGRIQDNGILSIDKIDAQIDRMRQEGQSPFAFRMRVRRNAYTGTFYPDEVVIVTADKFVRRLENRLMDSIEQARVVSFTAELANFLDIGQGQQENIKELVRDRSLNYHQYSAVTGNKLLRENEYMGEIVPEAMRLIERYKDAESLEEELTRQDARSSTGLYDADSLLSDKNVAHWREPYMLALQLLWFRNTVASMPRGLGEWQCRPILGAAPLQGVDKPVFCIGDIHADLEGFREILEGLGLIKKGVAADGSEDEWLAQDVIVRQGGDIPDRGSMPIATIRYIRRINKLAQAKNSQVICVLGNHDLLYLVKHSSGLWEDVEWEWGQWYGKEVLKTDTGFMVQGIDRDLWDNDSKFVEELRGLIREGGMVATDAIGGGIFSHGVITASLVEELQRQFPDRDMRDPEVFAKTTKDILLEAVASKDFSSIIFSCGEGVISASGDPGIANVYAKNLVLASSDMSDRVAIDDLPFKIQTVFHDPSSFFDSKKINAITGLRNIRSVVQADVGMTSYYRSGRAAVVYYPDGNGNSWAMEVYPEQADAKASSAGEKASAEEARDIDDILDDYVRQKVNRLERARRNLASFMEKAATAQADYERDRIGELEKEVREAEIRSAEIRSHMDSATVEEFLKALREIDTGASSALTEIQAAALDIIEKALPRIDEYAGAYLGYDARLGFSRRQVLFMTESQWLCDLLRFDPRTTTGQTSLISDKAGNRMQLILIQDSVTDQADLIYILVHEILHSAFPVTDIQPGEMVSTAEFLADRLNEAIVHDMASGIMRELGYDAYVERRAFAYGSEWDLLQALRETWPAHADVTAGRAIIDFIQTGDQQDMVAALGATWQAIFAIADIIKYNKNRNDFGFDMITLALRSQHRERNLELIRLALEEIIEGEDELIHEYLKEGLTDEDIDEMMAPGSEAVRVMGGFLSSLFGEEELDMREVLAGKMIIVSRYLRPKNSKSLNALRQGLEPEDASPDGQRSSSAGVYTVPAATLEHAQALAEEVTTLIGLERSELNGQDSRRINLIIATDISLLTQEDEQMLRQMAQQNSVAREYYKETARKYFLIVMEEQTRQSLIERFGFTGEDIETLQGFVDTRSRDISIGNAAIEQKVVEAAKIIGSQKQLAGIITNADMAEGNGIDGIIKTMVAQDPAAEQAFKSVFVVYHERPAADKVDLRGTIFDSGQFGLLHVMLAQLLAQFVEYMSNPEGIYETHIRIPPIDDPKFVENMENLIRSYTRIARAA